MCATCPDSPRVPAYKFREAEFIGILYITKEKLKITRCLTCLQLLSECIEFHVFDFGPSPDRSQLGKMQSAVQLLLLCAASSR